MTTMPMQWPGAAGFDASSINFGLGYNRPTDSVFTGSAFPMPAGLGDPSNFNFGGLKKPGFFEKSGIGANMETFNAAINGLGTLGSLWGGMKQLGLAKKQLAFQRSTANANMANQTQSYNTQIADRARSRGVMEGQSQGQVDDYIARNSLAKRTVG